MELEDPITDPEWNRLNAEYQRVSGLIGEAYIKSVAIKKELAILTKQRTDLIAQHRFYQKQLADAKTKAVPSNGSE